MAAPLKIDIITIFPRMLDGFLGESMVKRASGVGVIDIRAINPRDFTSDAHRSTDDRPYGGGPGMVMKCGPLFDAVESVRTGESRVILMSPQGVPYRQARARELAKLSHLILVCGHYEGVDERVRDGLIDEEISIGDYVLTSGVLAAAVVVDSITRLLPGVLGAGPEAYELESFSAGLLDYPQYTRPPEFRGMGIPEVLRSGNHAAVARWREEEALRRTRERRPDLLDDLD